MKKTSVLFVCMIALVALAAWAPNVEAFEIFQPGNCMGCHGDFRTGPYTSNTSQDGVTWNIPNQPGGGDASSLHQGHVQFANGNCQACHVQIGDTPLIGGPSGDGEGSCVGCHGREEDITPNDGVFGGAGPDWGDGLRAHHAINNNVGGCLGCHSGDVVIVGEDVPPARYLTLAIDPCSDAQQGDFG